MFGGIGQNWDRVEQIHIGRGHFVAMCPQRALIRRRAGIGMVGAIAALFGPPWAFWTELQASLKSMAGAVNSLAPLGGSVGVPCVHRGEVCTLCAATAG